ncbi:MAG: hypothetical protein IMW99_09600 [Firmicutes bacterium]|nr:hypothetical protein [Bacillota bacterium]
MANWPDQPITLHVKDADLRDVLKSLTRLVGLNLALDPAVGGRVTLDFAGVPLSQVLDVLTRTNGLDYQLLGSNVLLVAPAERLKAGFAAPASRKVFVLQHSSVDAVQPVVSSTFPDIKILADKGNNILVATGSASDLQQLEALISQLDRPLPQVLFDVRVEEISEDASRDLGLDWQFSLDMPQDATGAITAVKLNFAQQLYALEQKGSARLLARPSIAVVSGQTGKIMIGDRVPVVVTSVQQGIPTTTVQYIDAGIQLEITPQAAGDGLVTATIKPQVSSITNWTAQGMPQIRTREASTTLRLKDGDTVAIGGLIQQEDVKGNNSPPILGQLPVLEWIFGHQKTTSRKSEIVIFLTPHVVTGDTGLPPEWSALRMWNGAPSAGEPGTQAGPQGKP